MLRLLFKSPAGSLKCIIKQRVSCKDSHIFTVYNMRCLSSASVFIIIHCRQIIMHQGIRVDHLNGSHKRFDCSSFSAKQSVTLPHQHGTETLSTCHQTILHGLHDRPLISFFFRKILFQDLFYFFYSVRILFFKIHAFLHSHPVQESSFPLH